MENKINRNMLIWFCLIIEIPIGKQEQKTIGFILIPSQTNVHVCQFSNRSFLFWSPTMNILLDFVSIPFYLYISMLLFEIPCGVTNMFPFVL